MRQRLFLMHRLDCAAARRNQTQQPLVSIELRPDYAISAKFNFYAEIDCF